MVDEEDRRDEYRCRIDDCGYVWTGPSWQRDAVVSRHEGKAHDVITEAAAVARHDALPKAPRDVVSCLCPVEFFDPDCPIHAWESSW